jgi:hypothetical protein
MFTNDGVFEHPHLTGKQQLHACHQVIGIISMLVLYSICASVCTSQTPHNHSTKCLSAMSLKVLLGAHNQQQHTQSSLTSARTCHVVQWQA